VPHPTSQGMQEFGYSIVNGSPSLGAGTTKLSTDWASLFRERLGQRKLTLHLQCVYSFMGLFIHVKGIDFIKVSNGISINQWKT